MRISRRALLEMFGAGLAGCSMETLAFAQTLYRQSPPDISIASGPFQGTRTSLAAYQVPDWFRDAKFGIWAHWGPQSAIEAGDWYARNMYVQGHKQYHYHLQHYGHPSVFGYKDTIPSWKAERFDPHHLMQLYKKAGARYFMSMGVHHDNFDMWASKHNPWNASEKGPKRDIVHEWRNAARAEGLPFGVSEHLWIAYKWFSTSHGSDSTGAHAGVTYDGADPKNMDLYIDSDQIWKELDWNEDGIPDWWKRHWFLRMKDLLDNYSPDFLYSDGALPFQDYGLSIVAHLYNQHAKANGTQTEAVYFSKRKQDSDIGTCVFDRERDVLDGILPRPWQTDTCIGDWHYLRGMEYKSPKLIVDMLVDIVSKNGNLMLNFPLPASGMLDDEELQILDELAAWIDVNGAGIYGTRPWKVFGEGAAVGTNATPSRFNEADRRLLNKDDIRFTTKDGDLFAFVMGWPGSACSIRALGTGNEFRVGRVRNVSLVGSDAKLQWEQNEVELKIIFPEMNAPTKHASLLRIQGAL